MWTIYALSPLICFCVLTLPQVTEVSFTPSLLYQKCFFFDPLLWQKSHMPWWSFQNSLMSSYYPWTNSSRRLTVSFSSRNYNSCDSWVRKRTLQTCISFFVFPPQSCWRRKKLLWTVKCTCLPWAWPRPSSSHGSCPFLSSEKWQRQEIIYAVARESKRFRIESKRISPVMFLHMQLVSLEFTYNLNGSLTAQSFIVFLLVMLE